MSRRKLLIPGLVFKLLSVKEVSVLKVERPGPEVTVRNASSKAVEIDDRAPGIFTVESA
jgi:hypothetical protein